MAAISMTQGDVDEKIAIELEEEVVHKYNLEITCDLLIGLSEEAELPVSPVSD